MDCGSSTKRKEAEKRELGVERLSRPLFLIQILVRMGESDYTYFKKTYESTPHHAQAYNLPNDRINILRNLDGTLDLQPMLREYLREPMTVVTDASGSY